MADEFKKPEEKTNAKKSWAATVKAAKESHDLTERQEVASDALSRQLETKPTPKKHQWEITARIDNENLRNSFEASDEGTAWAMFCDSHKLKEAQRSRRFARPTIRDMGEVE